MASPASRKRRRPLPHRSPERRRRLLAGATVVFVAFGLAGCGSGPPQTVHAVGPIYEVTTAQISGLGTVLVDGKGFTLYLFVPDDHSSHSRCIGLCADAWPPLTVPSGVTSPLAGHGIRTSLLGTTVRSDGSRQVTYNGWPLYRYTIDTAPGQASGQGLNNLGGLWYVVSPDGNPVRS